MIVADVISGLIASLSDLTLVLYKDPFKLLTLGSAFDIFLPAALVGLVKSDSVYTPLNRSFTFK